MKTNLRERLTMYQCVIRPNVYFVLEFSFNLPQHSCTPAPLPQHCMTSVSFNYSTQMALSYVK